MSWQYGSFARRNNVCSLFGLLLLLVVFAGCGGTNTPALTPTPTSFSTQSTLLDLGLPEKALAAPVIGQVPASQVLHVAITFNINQALLDQLGQNTTVKQGNSQDVASLANSLGISDQTYAKIKAYFGVENATLKLSKLHTNLTIDAKTSTFAKLLQTNFVIHRLANRTFYTPDPQHMPQLPGFIASTITAITGLDNYSIAPAVQSFALSQQHKHMQSGQAANADCTPDPQTLVPTQIAHAYNYDQFWKLGWAGENTIINLIEVDGFSNSDISNYFACAHFRGKLDVVNVDGARPQPGGESTLDLDMIAGLAPAAHIVDYETDTSNSALSDSWTRVNDELQQLINNNTKNTGAINTVSMSLGTPEDGFTLGNIRAMHQSFEILTKVEHMTVLAASGDCAAFMSHVFNQLAVSYPASDTDAVGVGGTQMSTDIQGVVNGEAVWADGSDTSNCHNQWGSGGGLSTLFQRQTWQNAAGVQNRFSNGKRQVPDIAAVSFDIAVYFGGQWVSDGGTSAATPIWAAGLSLVNEGLAQKKHVFIYGPSIFYAVANHPGNVHPYHDVTSGNNLFYPATPGWDYSTGLGTPDLVSFFLVLFRNVK